MDHSLSDKFLKLENVSGRAFGKISNFVYFCITRENTFWKGSKFENLAEIIFRWLFPMTVIMQRLSNLGIIYWVNFHNFRYSSGNQKSKEEIFCWNTDWRWRLWFNGGRRAGRWGQKKVNKFINWFRSFSKSCQGYFRFWQLGWSLP
jgi:hypothetical protein